jgi:hypothetical protein
VSIQFFSWQWPANLSIGHHKMLALVRTWFWLLSGNQGLFFLHRLSWEENYVRNSLVPCPSKQDFQIFKSRIILASTWKNCFEIVCHVWPFLPLSCPLHVWDKKCAIPYLPLKVSGPYAAKNSSGICKKQLPRMSLDGTEMNADLDDRKCQSNQSTCRPHGCRAHVLVEKKVQRATN